MNPREAPVTYHNLTLEVPRAPTGLLERLPEERGPRGHNTPPGVERPYVLPCSERAVSGIHA